MPECGALLHVRKADITGLAKPTGHISDGLRPVLDLAGRRRSKGALKHQLAAVVDAIRDGDAQGRTRGTGSVRRCRQRGKTRGCVEEGDSAGVSTG